MSRPLHLATSGAADYLMAQAREALFQVFFARGNEPIEFSALRTALEAHGVKAKDSSHWGILAACLKNDRLVEVAGRETAVVASRNQARNQTYQLSRDGWAYAQLLAERRGWKRILRVIEPTPEQVALEL